MPLKDLTFSQKQADRIQRTKMQRHLIGATLGVLPALAATGFIYKTFICYFKSYNYLNFFILIIPFYTYKYFKEYACLSF